MAIDHKIRDEKLQYDINRKTEKYQLYHVKIFNKYEYLTGEELLPPNQRQVI